eukprot:288360-Pleurochrysis_carterae.AAC.2
MRLRRTASFITCIPKHGARDGNGEAAARSQRSRNGAQAISHDRKIVLESLERLPGKSRKREHGRSQHALAQG